MIIICPEPAIIRFCRKFDIFVCMVRFCIPLGLILLLFSCSGEDEPKHTRKSRNRVQTEKAIDPVPRVVNNRISIKRQFVPDETLEQFIIEYKGENFKNAVMNFVILNKNKDTLFSRLNIQGKNLLDDSEDIDLSTEDKKIGYIYHKMSTFFSLKNFSCPPYTINDPNGDSFVGDLKVWREIENDSNVTSFEFSLLPNGGSEVLVYSRLMDSILVYDRTH